MLGIWGCELNKMTSSPMTGLYILLVMRINTEITSAMTDLFLHWGIFCNLSRISYAPEFAKENKNTT